MSEQISRRTLLCATAGGAVGTMIAAPAPASASGRTPAVVRELEEKIRQAMPVYGVPGVSLGLRHRGVDYVRGFGVTDVAAPAPVDGDTVFRIASTTKTFVGTGMMRLVERGRIDLDRTIRSYLPDFRTSDPAASARVTVRQVLDHSAGWLGDFFLDTGSDDGALARYVAAMSRLPQLTAPGEVFGYNNAALSLAGRLIEVVTGTTFERALQSLVMDPLRLAHTRFHPEEIRDVSIAVPHGFDEEGNPVSVPAALALPRSIHGAGGLFSSARDQLRWARFHLGDGSPLLSARSLRAMRSRPGPGGTLFVELDGAGVTWMLRPTAEGPKVVQHGGDLGGQHSGFLMVPERDFALTVLTNSEGGPALLDDLFGGDWALSRFTGLHNLPAVPLRLSAAELAPYEGPYLGQQIGYTGETEYVPLRLTAADGVLVVSYADEELLRLAFYRNAVAKRDHVVVLQPDGSAANSRANFVRDRDGSIAWLRVGGRLYRHDGVAPAAVSAARPARPSSLTTLPHPDSGLL
ncbi:serine hydrolase domain-containing protein [Actinoplanes rectilineatus]|uniref:serine hydrolase domain-containing protein n=1 Tax=Actinoplanes rectilineatus TaxID=113571 RepID=UPI0007C813FC|nr:serine hydrolase domain-containing protein [Actinoplanes rectilineatus]